MRPSRLLSRSAFLLLMPALAAQTPHRHDPAHNHEHEVIPLDEVIISAPLNRPLYQQAQAASIMASQALNLGNEPSIGQTLSRVPGVSSSFFGPAASRPIIRGLEGDRIKVLQNGLYTVDASSASPDHGVSFDVSNLKSIEVVRGPATLLYGSNAIGGVVNAIDGRIVDEELEAGTIRGSLGSRFSSVDNGHASSFMLEGGLGHGLAFHIEGFTRAAEDFRVPGELRSKAFQEMNPLPAGDLEQRDVVTNSYLRAEGLSGGLSYVWDEGFIGFSWTEYHSRYGSPAAQDVFIDMNQTRLDVRGAFYHLLPKVKELSYRFAWSDYEHTEFEGGQDNTVFKNDGYDLRIEAKHEKVAGLEGVVGIQSELSNFMISGGEAFMPPSSTQSNAIFFFEELSASDKLRLQFGGRYDRIDVQAVNSDVFGPAQERGFDNLSGSIGAVFAPGDTYSAAFTLTYAERAPTAQELFANGVHAATNTFEVGNPNLGLESSIGFDVNLRKRTGWVTGAIGGYYTRYNSFIGLLPTGAVVVTPDGDVFNQFVYRSVDAEFIGGEIEAQFHLLHPLEGTDEDAPRTNLHWEVRADAVRARNAETGTSLPRIPPFHLTNALVFQRGGLTARLEGIYAGPQDRLAANELPTDSYFLVNASLNYQFKLARTTCDLFIKGMNLTDAEAREHTSFLKDQVPLPGRGLVVGFRTTF